MADPQTAGTLGTATIRLAVDLDNPADRYQRRYIPARPAKPPSLTASEGAQPADSETQLWKMDSWAGGEGWSRWEPGSNRYYESSNVRPVKIGDGVELGAASAKTVASGGGAFNGGNYVTVGNGKVWCAKDTTIYGWDTATGRWDSGMAIGSASPVVSIADPGDGWVYVGLEDKTVRRVQAASNASWLTGMAGDPILMAWSGALYMVDIDDLYEVDIKTASTKTLVADLSDGSTVWPADDTSRRRITASERGPVWLQRLDSGQTYILEYNVYAGAQARLGKLPVDYAWPYNITYASGFVFVAFRYANAHTDSGDAYIYFQRGAQRGVLGPIRSLSGSTGSEAVQFAGVVGEQLLFVFDGALWGYTGSSGGVSMVGKLTTDTTPFSATSFGREVFVAGLNDGTAGVVDKLNLDGYATTGTIDSGRWDFWYPGLQKMLLDVTVHHDALPASTSVALAVSTDGGSYTTVTGTDDTDGATSYTWTVSDTGTTVAGKDFSIRLTLNGTASATPTIRNIVVRAGAGAFILEWVLTVDCNTSTTGLQDSSTVIDSLNALTTSGPVTFTDPWQNTVADGADSFTVKVEEVVTPAEQSDHSPTAQMRLRSTSLVEVT